MHLVYDKGSTQQYIKVDNPCKAKLYIEKVPQVILLMEASFRKPIGHHSSLVPT